ncbi:MAG TPA: SEC-C metal-binding domain-containing protein [Candidatus Nanopelagicales bacterium]|nr:SEC-C metal-binding domain-containing protein [Candidatus Nanopelagicales bacterium]
MPPTGERTGHQHHFLSRLDRLARPDVELALELYRDHEQVHFLLGELRVPEGHERIALSLDDPREGPFVIVTREGRFVTCLGRGMKPGRCPVVPRAQLDAVIARHEDLRGRIAAAWAIEGKGGGLSRLLRRIYDAGDAACREDMLIAASIQPVYAPMLLKLHGELAQHLFGTTMQAISLLRRTQNPKPYTHDFLHAYWKSHWMLTHLAVLSGQDTRALLAETPPEALQEMKTFFSNTFLLRTIAGAVRGMWSAARIGKILLPNYKQAYARADGLVQVLEAVLTLALLGLRHTRLRAEVRKVLLTLPEMVAGRDPEDKFRHFIENGMRQMCGYAFDEPEKGLSYHLSIGHAEALDRTSHLPPGSPYAFRRAEDVPEDLARTLAVCAPHDFVEHRSTLIYLFAYLPWLSRASTGDLYLPRDFLEATRRPWTPARTRDLLYGMIEQDRSTALAPRTEPSRSGPCPCGSGKKYKRCCGEAT